MSEAPRRMASSSSLLTKRTMGASSTSSRLTPSVAEVLAAGDLQRVELHAVVVAEVRHLLLGALDGLVDELLQLVVFDHHGIDAQAGLELDLVDGVQVGGVGHAKEQALAAPEHRQHAMLGQQLVGDQAGDFKVDRQRVEIEQRHAEFGRGGDGDVARLGGALPTSWVTKWDFFSRAAVSAGRACLPR